MSDAAKQVMGNLRSDLDFWIKRAETAEHSIAKLNETLDASIGNTEKAIALLNQKDAAIAELRRAVERRDAALRHVTGCAGPVADCNMCMAVITQAIAYSGSEQTP